MTPESAFLEEITEAATMECAMPPLVVELMDLIGFDATMALLRHYGGATMYLPTVAHAFRGLRDQRIRAEFDGTNYRELQMRYSLTRSHLHKILSEGKHCER